MKQILLSLQLLFLVSACGGGGGNGSASNAPPSAFISTSALSGHIPLEIQFDASGSSDPDGTIVDYAWDFGDGTRSLGSRVTHTFTSTGTFSVTVTVTDDDGVTDTASTSIESHVQIAGFYSGSITSNISGITNEIEVIIGSNNKIHAWEFFNIDPAYWGDFDMDEQTANGSLFAEIVTPGFTFVDGSTFGIIEVTGNVVAQQGISAIFDGVGDSGTIDLQYIPQISNQPYSVADVSGTWSFSDGMGFSDSLTITEVGSLSYSATDGCVAEGEIAELDVDLNGLSFSLNLNCPPDVDVIANGTITGVAFVDDFFSAEPWIVLAGSVGNSFVLFTFSGPQTMATSTGVMKSYPRVPAQVIDGAIKKTGRPSMRRPR